MQLLLLGSTSKAILSVFKTGSRGGRGCERAGGEGGGGLLSFEKDKQVSHYLDTVSCLNNHDDMYPDYTDKHHLVQIVHCAVEELSAANRCNTDVKFIKILKCPSYPSPPSASMSVPLCSAAMALASGIPTRSRKHSAGSARMELYFS